MKESHLRAEEPDGMLSDIEIAHAAAREYNPAGISGLATVSAPTALAHRLARQAGLSLAALSKQGVMTFDGDEHGNP